MFLLSLSVWGLGPVVTKGPDCQPVDSFFKSLSIPFCVSQTTPFVASLKAMGRHWRAMNRRALCSPLPRFPSPSFWKQHLSFPLGNYPILISICVVCMKLMLPCSARGWLWTWIRPSRVSVIGLGINMWPKTWESTTRVWLELPEKRSPLCLLGSLNWYYVSL